MLFYMKGVFGMAPLETALETPTKPCS